jgi:hypothetical protein
MPHAKIATTHEHSSTSWQIGASGFPSFLIDRSDPVACIAGALHLAQPITRCQVEKHVYGLECATTFQGRRERERNLCLKVC